MNSQPFARCVLHVRCVVRNPSRFRFYLFGILREFREASSFALIVGGVGFFFFGVCLVNFFYQH
jgi:hypothetical protein